MASLGRTLLVLAALLAVAGLVLLGAERLGVRLGRLPGDVKVERGPVTFYFPLATSIVVSVLLSLALWLFSRR